MNLGAFPTIHVPDRGPIFRPGGYPTLVSGSPQITSDQASKTVIYYAQDAHNAFPIIRNGVIHAVYFDEPRLVLSSAHEANAIYDVFGVERSGNGHIVTGPKWSNAGAGVGDRGSGGGTTELTRAAGFYVNRWGIPGLNADGSVFIAPGEGTYLFSIFIDGSAGQVTCRVSYGQTRKWALWSAHNKRQIILKGGDSSASWSVGGSGSVRAQNGSSSNSLTSFQGLADGPVAYRLRQAARLVPNQATSAFTGYVRAGIGYNVTNAYSGKYGQIDDSISNMPASMAITQIRDVSGEYIAPAAIGINTATACESLSNSLSQLLYGTEASCLFTAEWMG